MKFANESLQGPPHEAKGISLCQETPAFTPLTNVLSIVRIYLKKVPHGQMCELTNKMENLCIG